MENFDKQKIDEDVRAGFPFNHRWHNNFHLEMPFGLINDPNGLVRHGKDWHIFFQWNPFGVVHKNKCWAYTTTRDFVNYSVPVLAMHPSDEHDKDGCYSGGGFVSKKTVNVVYTCNAKDENGVRTSAQRVGILKDGKVEKDKIIIPGNPEGYTAHFRDPYMFTRKGTHYLVLGAQRADETGCALIYENDKGRWKFRGEIKTDYKNFGYMWECPGIVQFGDIDVMIFSPQGLESEEFKYQNKYQSGYMVGKLSLDSLDFMHGNFEELDYGFDFYAPQVFHSAGRVIMLGWMGMPDCDDDYPTGKEGWRFSLTFPREINLAHGRITSRPMHTLKNLRKNYELFEGREFTDMTEPLYEGTEIKLDLRFGKATKITFTLNYAGEKVLLTYDKSEQTMTIDRSKMKLGGKGIRKFKLFADENFKMHFLIDRTAVEVFMQNGEKVASFFVFPKKDCIPELSITGNKEIESVDCRVWELGKFNFA